MFFYSRRESKIHLDLSGLNILYPYFSFPFLRRFTFEKLRDRGRNVLEGRVFDNAAALEAGTDIEHRDRHILGHIGAVSAVVSAVIGNENDGVILWNAVIDLLNASDRIVRILHILGTHPAVIVTGVIGVCEIEEEKIGALLVYILDRAGSDELVDVLVVIAAEKIAGIELAGTANVAQLIPGDEHSALLLAALEHLNDAVDRTHLRGIGIGRSAVAHGIDAVEKRHVAGQSYRGKHGLRRKRIGRKLLHFLGKGMPAGHHSIGTHTVREDKNYFL